MLYKPAARVYRARVFLINRGPTMNHAQLIFDLSIAAHRTAIHACREARRAGAPDTVRAALRAARDAAHDAVLVAYEALHGLTD